MITDKQFRDWEQQVFGYGYGTGEAPILTALKTFMDTLGDNGAYRYEDLESALTAPVTWLLINALCHADVLTYGTSPRGAWLTEKGRALQDYVTGKTVDQLYDVLLDDNIQPENRCAPDYCNCELPKGQRCSNPLFGI